MDNVKTKKQAEANASDVFKLLDQGKKGYLNVNLLQDMIENDNGQTIGKLVEKEALDLINTLRKSNKGKINKMQWNTVFGSIFEKMQKQKKGTAPATQQKTPVKKVAATKPAVAST